MSSAQDPFYIVKEEIQDSVSFFFVLDCSFLDFLFRYEIDRMVNLSMGQFDQSIDPSRIFFLCSVNCLLELDFTLLDELGTRILLDFEDLMRIKLCMYAFVVICVLSVQLVSDFIVLGKQNCKPGLLSA